MRRLVWLSDTHLNVLPKSWRNKLFVAKIKRAKPDCVLVTGDITTGRVLERDISWLSEAFREQEVLFVMGNHDYYHRGFSEVDESVCELVKHLPNVKWLSKSGVISLSETTAIVGHEGWYDASLGDPSLLRYTFDWRYIDELKSLSSLSDRISVFIERATRSARMLESSLVSALQTHDVVYVATHFPPWPERNLHFQRFWLPYNTNAVMGKMIENVARQFLDKKIVVLAGHTHEPDEFTVGSNIECRVSRATRWGRVRAHSIIEY